MDILVTICARGGSKGIPFKNIKLLNGKPLIAYTIDAAERFAERFCADIELSTEDDKIIEVSKNYGLETNYRRPVRLATDKAGKVEVIKHLLEYKENKKNKRYELILDLDVTSPLRTLTDLEKGYKKIRKREDALNIYSVSPASRNPYFNMVEETNNGFFKLVKDRGEIKARQDAPKVYDMNASFYFFRREFFEKGYTINTTDRSLAYIVPHICFDLDQPIDFKFMDFLLREGILDFEI